MARSLDDIALRIRVGHPLSKEELALLDRAALERGDLGSWMLLRVGHGAEALAARVAAELAREDAEAIIRGACELRGGLRHAGWHVVASLAERRPLSVGAIESAISSWAPRTRPWLRTWLTEAENGQQRPYHRLAQNLGLMGEHLPHDRVKKLLPVLATLRELDLSEVMIDDDPLRELVSAAELQRLDVLSLQRAEIDDERCEILANDARLPSLSRLVLNANLLSAEGAARLVRAPALPHLQQLELAGCEIDLLEFARALHEGATDARPRPVCLDLSQCRRVSEGLVALAQSPALLWIAGLDLHHVAIEPEAVLALAASKFASSLTQISVNKRSLGEKGVRALLEAPWLGNIRSMKLFNQRAGDTLAPALRRLGGVAIERLELMHEELGLEAARALGTADLSRLQELRVSHNPLGDDGLAAILGNPTLSSLEIFEAFNCGADVQTARTLSQARHLSRLRILRLGDHPSAAAAQVLSSASLPALRQLQLVGATEGAIGQLAEASAFAKCFVTNQRYSDWESLA